MEDDEICISGPRFYLERTITLRNQSSRDQECLLSKKNSDDYLISRDWERRQIEKYERLKTLKDQSLSNQVSLVLMINTISQMNVKSIYQSEQTNSFSFLCNL